MSVSVYDVSGQLVRVLKDAVYEDAGRHEVVWRGLDAAGSPVSSGTYFYRITAGSYSETKRMVLVK